MRQIGLFAGIGGFELAAKWMGWETVAWCEKDELCQAHLKYHFPNAEANGDIRTTDFSKYRGRCEIVTGGFPCQPFSIAGEQNGSSDDRELSQEMLRAVDEIKPRFVVGENVGNILNKKFKDELNLFCTGLENIGYQTPLVFDSAADTIGLPTMERHIWIITEANEKRLERCIDKTVSRFGKMPREFSRSNQREQQRWALPESRVCRMGEGISERLDTSTISKSKFHKHSLMAYGNAIPPQMAYEIFKSLISN